MSLPANFEKLSLVEQCGLLSLPLRELPMCYDKSAKKWMTKDKKKFKRPEPAAHHHYKLTGIDGGYCEGGAILLLMKSACLNYLAEINTFNERKDACTRYFEAQCEIHKDKARNIIHSIKLANQGEIADNFAEIYSFPFIREEYPGLTKEIITNLHDCLGKELLVDIAHQFVRSPYLYRKGWPDLTLLDGGVVKFVEVKTSDKLHESQAVIVRDFIKPLQLDCSVLKLRKKYV